MCLPAGHAFWNAAPFLVVPETILASIVGQKDALTFPRVISKHHNGSVVIKDALCQ